MGEKSKTDEMAEGIQEQRAVDAFKELIDSLTPLSIPYIRRLTTYNNGDVVVSYYDKFYAVFERGDNNEISCMAIGENKAEQGKAAIILIDVRFLNDSELFAEGVKKFATMVDSCDEAIILEQLIGPSDLDNPHLIYEIVKTFESVQPRIVH